jgi:hypothetical protein
MTTQATIKRQIQKLETMYRGDWVKFLGDYHTNAFESCRDGMYQISITKEDGKWIVYADDHEPEDIDNNAPFSTLAEAKEFAEEFGEFFEECFKDNL